MKIFCITTTGIPGINGRDIQNWIDDASESLDVAIRNAIATFGREHILNVEEV